MPVILRVDGYRFYFYSDEHPPIHIHVKKGGNRARVILEPEVLVNINKGFKKQEMKRILEIVDAHYDFLINTWNEAFNQ